MSELSATIRLRPTRIGFLVRPTDLASVRKIMRGCACLWGGMYNPVIPVFRVPPKEWKPERFEPTRGLDIAKGYVRFFEPDVLVEAEHGLLEDAGLGALRQQHAIEPLVITLNEFLTPQDDRDWSEPRYGLGIIDLLRHLYETEQRFTLRDAQPAIFVKPQANSGLVESVFGVYPQQKDARYIADWYRDVYRPNEVAASVQTWLDVFVRGAQTPLRVTRMKLEPQRYWHHRLVIFVFDPTKPTDLIDLWNIRLEPSPVLPVPIGWVSELADALRKIILDEHQPIRGNPQGLMHHATVEFARSLGKERSDEVVKQFWDGLPKEALAIKHWRTRVWVPHDNEMVHQDRRMSVTADEQNVTLTVKDDNEPSCSFQTLGPSFAARYSANQHRWANVVRLSIYGRGAVATVLPFNTFDRRWPRLASGGDAVIVGSEGWIFTQQHKGWSEHLRLMRQDDAIVGSLKERGIEAKLSEPGLIAKQMFEQLDGLWGINLLADVETLKLLNHMAGGARRKSNATDTIDESFERRTAPMKKWIDLVTRRKVSHPLPLIDLDDFTKRNIIRLGLETTCPHCQATNWHGLTVADYKLTCERCLKAYDFPQAGLLQHNKNWAYRVVGPFSVPDFGRGSYSALLTLRALKNLDTSGGAMTFSTAMSLAFDGVNCEADLLAWTAKGQFDGAKEPALIIGEAKSLGQGNLIKRKDLEKLKAIARKLPGAVVLISVLRDHFTPLEKKLLKAFVIWGRQADERGRPRTPVILLTSNELFCDHYISIAWKGMPEPHKSFSGFNYFRSLRSFADATQRLYLGLPGLYEWQDEQRKKKVARKMNKAAS